MVGYFNQVSVGFYTCNYDSFGGFMRYSFRFLMRKYWALYLLLLPTLAYLLIFRYYPILMQVVLPFKDYKILNGIWGSPWGGFAAFKQLTEINGLGQILFNTVFISVTSLVVGFFPPIILAIFFFDLTSIRYKKISQSISYIPHFFSWVIIYSMVNVFFCNTGFVNSIIKSLGGTEKHFLYDMNYFYIMLFGSGLWKEVGYSTILFTAALTNINPEIIEASRIDGAGPFQRTFHVLLPCIKGVMIFVLTLSVGNLLKGANVEQLLLFYNPANYRISDVIDTWVYREGITKLQYTLGASLSLLQSAFGLILLLTCNRLASKFAGMGIW